MKILKSVLDQETMDNVKKDIDELFSQNVWSSSQMLWPKNILKKVTGDCSICRVKENIAEQIKKCLLDKLPPAEKMDLQYYIWKQNSGISLHDDRGYKYGATIYLNNEWDINDGGIFLWKEGSELKGFCPEYNSMVINTETQPHLVTSISPLASQFRHTIQIWGF
jgi:hypothetical protein